MGETPRPESTTVTFDATINAAAAAARIGAAALAVAAAVLVAGWDAGRAWWTVWTETWQ